MREKEIAVIWVGSETWVWCLVPVLLDLLRVRERCVGRFE